MIVLVTFYRRAASIQVLLGFNSAFVPLVLLGLLKPLHSKSSPQEFCQPEPTFC